MDADPATMLVLRRVRRGAEAEFEEALRDVIRAASAFDGHLGATVVRPAPGRPEHVLVVRWASAADLEAWRASATCAEWLARVAPITEALDAYELHGMEAFFDLPGPRAPARWKMAVVTFVAIYPLILALSALLQRGLPELPLALRVAVTSGVLVPLMTWVVMPWLTGRLARWLTS